MINTDITDNIRVLVDVLGGDYTCSNDFEDMIVVAALMDLAFEDDCPEYGTSSDKEAAVVLLSGYYLTPAHYNLLKERNKK